MARGNRRSGKGGNRRIINTRIVPDGEGNRAEKVNRMISAVKESQSIVQVCVGEDFELNNATLGIFSFGRLRATDEFSSFADQYETYKVAGMRFDIFDEAPGNYSRSIFGTYHGTGGGTPPASYAEVVDLPDANHVAPGTGKLTLYWYPSGPTENGWYNVSDATIDFGGLAAAVGTPAVATPKFNCRIIYVVHFRARR